MKVIQNSTTEILSKKIINYRITINIKIIKIINYRIINYINELIINYRTVV